LGSPQRRSQTKLTEREQTVTLWFPVC